MREKQEKLMMNSFTKILSYATSILIVIGLIYGVWQFQKKINFSFSYEDQVQEVIQKEIDPKLDSLEQKIQELENEIEAIKKR